MKKLILALNKIISIFLVILLSIVTVGCEDTELSTKLRSQEIDNYSLRQELVNLQTQISTLETRLTSSKNLFKSDVENQAKKLFELAKLHNSIKAYEFFLQGSANLDDLKSEAFQYIYELTKKADLIVGYQYFLQYYPNTPQVKEVNYRLYEIFYEIAETKNIVPEYLAFLSNFEGAPENLREKALDRAVSLECQSLLSEYQKTIESKQVDDIYHDFIADKIGKHLYEAALEANEKDDKVVFLQKYNTILKCDLFKGSNTRFALLRDSEITKLLQSIEHEIKIIREDINKSNKLILQRLSTILDAQNQQTVYIQNVQNQQTAYIQEISNIVKYQSQLLEKIQKPPIWDDKESVWENFMRIGEPALQFALTTAEALKYVGLKK